MRRLNMKIILILSLSINWLLAQSETVGFEFNQHSRYIDSFRTTSSIWSASYRNELSTGTRLGVSLGLDNVKFFENDAATEPMLKSTNQIFLQLEGLQKIQYIYLKGAAQFYSIQGDLIETTGSNSTVVHHNIYRMFEFPLGAGFTFPIYTLDCYVGLNKVYFYGTNEKEILVNNSGTKTSLGSSSRQTFNTELGLGGEAIILYHLTDTVEFELNFIKYADKDFSVRFSIWGPLKRMLYVN